jgi:plastocyanin
VNALHRALRAGALLSLASCTPGGVLVPPSAAGTGASIVTVDVSLTQNPPPIPLPAGTGGGYKPALVNVRVGDSVVFVNTDSFAHTATSIAGASFPASSPFTAAALTSSGSQLTHSWSSGSLAPGARSHPILVDAPGTYFFGCFYHYGAPMRGEIVAQ